MYILGIDLEGMNEDLLGKGIDLSTDRVIEIGAILWDCRTHSPVKIYSELIDEKDRRPMSEEVTELTGIDDTMLKDWGLKGEQIKMGLERLALIIKKADFLMAHNGPSYDVPMLEALFERNKVPFPKSIWIDSKEDIEFPRKMHNKSLAGLEHSHGFINPFPHRALSDVYSMLKIASHYDYKRMAALAQSPKVKIVATLTAPNWKNHQEVEKFNQIKNRVSRARFQWNPSEKKWTKTIHKLLLDENKVAFDFDWAIENAP